MLPDEQTDFVVPSTTEMLVAALARLVTGAELRRSLGAANRVRVEERYAHETMVEAYRALYFD